MKYDFDTVVDRRNTGSLKWDVRENELPMWVADMNFETVPTITQAIIERAAHPAFGYFSPTKEYYSSIINWHKTRNLVKDLTQKHIG